jgi:DNA-binding CsgD family transcriptional regulator
MPGEDVLLLERDEQLAEVRAAVELLHAGSGCVLVVTGPVGIGKTTLLEAAAEQARGQGVRVLTASGRELERDLGHGVTRQLLDPALGTLTDDERATLLDGPAALAAPVLGLAAPTAAPAADPEFAARHGLTWLLTGLAERRPVVLALDDAQWADPPALRWIAYLSQRLDQAAVMVLVTRRSAEPSSDEAALDAICRAGRELQLAPLSTAAVAELVRARTGVIPDAQLIAACATASGGNPFLLDATLAALDEEGVSALGQPLAGPRRVAPTILRRLARLPADATALARAVAVLGDDTQLAAAAQLADLSLVRAAAAADALVSADLFSAGEKLSFAHALVRDAIAEDVGQYAMQAAHSRAADVLRGLGVPVEQIASHLLLAPAAGDPTAIADLRDAARHALAQGAPTTAVTLLRRALTEPPQPSERSSVLLELGMAELVSGDPCAAERLGDAIEVLDDPSTKAATAQARTAALLWQNRLDDAVAAIDRVRSEVATYDSQLTLTLDALRLAITMAYISTSAETRPVGMQLRRALRLATPATVETRGAAIMVAAMDAFHGTPSSVVRTAVHKAWGDDALLDALGPEHPFCTYGAVVLWCAGELGAFEAIATRIADRAATDGSALGAYQALAFRAIARAGMGRLADAEAEAELAWQSGAASRVSFSLDAVQALLALIAVERGDLPRARMRLAGIDVESDVLVNRVAYAMAAARLARAEGATARERDLLRELSAWHDACGFGTWLFGPWPAALALALGPCDEARELAERALTDARMRGRPGEIGIAMRSQALVCASVPDIERLQTAVAELERSELALEHARTLMELGAAMRRRGHRRDARKPLAAALELASRCGATALAERARIELQDAGARPRRLAVSGRDSLTPSERRIAMLAAEGRSNREIAQTLFVSSKTVETHLRHAYNKLDITSRTQLPSALTRD